jgi:hypothetical protein
MPIPSFSSPFAPKNSSDDPKDTSRPSIDLSKLKRVRLRDFALRFLFGGAISVLAALLGFWFTPRFGGLFTTFPAILLASLTLLGHKEGLGRASDDAKGAVGGAVALVVCALFLALTLFWLAGGLVLVLALILWLMLASLLYLFGMKLGWLRASRIRNDSHK